jgi:hypothetical protein
VVDFGVAADGDGDGDEGAGVVGDAHQALRCRWLVPVLLARSVARAAHWSASASSVGREGDGALLADSHTAGGQDESAVAWSVSDQSHSKAT